MDYSYVKTINNKIVILVTDRSSLRCRQRSNNEPFHFISFKEMKKNQKLDKNRIIGPINYNTISKL